MTSLTGRYQNSYAGANPQNASHRMRESSSEAIAAKNIISGVGVTNIGKSSSNIQKADEKLNNKNFAGDYHQFQLDKKNVSVFENIVSRSNLQY